jgi:hypothetical protein
MEPEPDADTLAKLDPLTGIAGVWNYDLQPIDAKTVVARLR